MGNRTLLVSIPSQLDEWMDIGFRCRRRGMIKDRSGILALGLDKLTDCPIHT
jgi:hypothetical protein